MLNSKTVNDAFDLILRQALIDDSKRELNALNNEIMDVKFSSRLEKSIERMEKKYRHSLATKKFKKKIPKIASTAAGMTIAVSLATNPNVQAFVSNIIEKIFDDHNYYEFIGEDEVTPETFNNEIRPQYMCEGYSISQINYYPAIVVLKYRNEFDSELRLSYGIADSYVAGVDNEHSNIYNITIYDIPAVYYESTTEDRPSYLVWEQNGYAFVISAQISMEEFVNIAKNLKFD